MRRGVNRVVFDRGGDVEARLLEPDRLVLPAPANQVDGDGSTQRDFVRILPVRTAPIDAMAITVLRV